MLRPILLVLPIALLWTDPAPAQVTLQWKLDEGSKTTNVETKAHQTLTIGGKPIETTSIERAKVTRTVGKRQPDDSLKVEIKIESLQIEVELPGGKKFALSSSEANQKPDADKLDEKDKLIDEKLAPIREGLREVLKNRTTFVLDKDNQVQEVLNTVKAEKLGDQIKHVVDPQYLKQKWTQEMSMLPDGPVKVGDTWKRHTVLRIAGGQALAFDVELRYAGTVEKGGKTFDKIDTQAKKVSYSLDANASAEVKVPKSDLKIDSSHGSVLFDRQRGDIVEHIGKTRIRGDMTLEINGTGLPAELDLTLETMSKSYAE